MISANIYMYIFTSLHTQKREANTVNMHYTNAE